LPSFYHSGFAFLISEHFFVDFTPVAATSEFVWKMLATDNVIV
jgi:hypothetical protein